MVCHMKPGYYTNRNFKKGVNIKYNHQKIVNKTLIDKHFDYELGESDTFEFHCVS
jgi:hypothetical protein